MEARSNREPRASSGSGWSEERIHAWLARRGVKLGGVTVGSHGHDAAVLRASNARSVVCCDQTIENVHFASEARPGPVGRKAVCRALSDLAATAAAPRAVLLTIAAPPATSERWMRDAIRGVEKHAARFGAALVGGDLAAHAGPRALTVTAIGELAGRRRPPGRDRARPGDVVLLTGPVGGSRRSRHMRIEPRVAEGTWLHAHGARALMDVSDGLAVDLSRIAVASGVRVELESVPVHRDARRAARVDAVSAREHALIDGEDHELVATLSPSSWRRAEAAGVRAFPALRCIGRVRRGAGLWIRDEDGGALARWSGSGGYLHGS